MSDIRTGPRPARQDHRLDALLDTPLHRHMGIRAADPADPALGIVFDVGSDLVNNSAMLHGGLVAASLDIAAAYAIFPLLDDDEVVLTNSLTISYLRPAPLGARLRAHAVVLRRGRATAFLRAEVVLADKLVATAQIVKAVVDLKEWGTQ